MEYQKIRNSLGNIPDKVPRFVTKKWIEVHNQSGETYNTNKQIRFKTSMLRSDLCDFSDAYIVVKGIVIVSADERDRDEMNRQVRLKNNAPFISCFSKINGLLVENAEDLYCNANVQLARIQQKLFKGICFFVELLQG